MFRMSDGITFSGTFHHGGWEEPEGWVDGAPTSSTDQNCAFCGTAHVGWVHPLDPAKVSYRAWGKGYTLPHSGRRVSDASSCTRTARTRPSSP